MATTVRLVVSVQYLISLDTLDIGFNCFSGSLVSYIYSDKGLEAFFFDQAIVQVPMFHRGEKGAGAPGPPL